MTPEACPQCAAPWTHRLWAACTSCGYRLSETDYLEKSPLHGQSDLKHNNVDVENTKSHLTYLNIFKIILIAHIVFYGVIGFSYGAFLAIRGIPQGGVRFPFQAGSISAPYINTPGDNPLTQEEQKRIVSEDLVERILKGGLCFISVTLSGVSSGIFAGLISTVGVWVWKKRKGIS